MRVMKRLNRNKTRVVLVLTVALLLALPALSGVVRSQIRVGTNLVIVPVSVRGSDGNLVTGLTRDDFTIFEDGKPQTITSFDDDAQPLFATIVVDTGITGNGLMHVSKMLFALGAGITPEDSVSVFRYDHIVDQLSPFSSDPEVLKKSFDAIGKIADARPKEQEELITGGPKKLRSILGIFPNGNKADTNNHVLHNAIYEAAMALKPLPTDRMKIIFVVSDGRASGKANVHSFDHNVELLLQNNIQVFGVSPEYTRFGTHYTLGDYAESTGGDVHDGGSENALEHAFNQITEQARHQYVLGYTSTNIKGRPGVFREIDVRTNHTDQKVIHRKGYVRYTAP